MRESYDVSFKGVSFKGSYADKVKKSFAFFNEHQYNLEENLRLLKKYIGKAPIELASNTDKWQAIKKQIIKSQEDSTVVIKEKNWTRHLLDAMGAPIT